MNESQRGYDFRPVSAEFLEDPVNDPPTLFVEVLPTDVSTLGDDTWGENHLAFNQEPPAGYCVRMTQAFSPDRGPPHVHQTATGDYVEDFSAVVDEKGANVDGKARGTRKILRFALLCGLSLVAAISGLVYGLVRSHDNGGSASTSSAIGTLTPEDLLESEDEVGISPQPSRARLHISTKTPSGVPTIPTRGPIHGGSTSAPTRVSRPVQTTMPPNFVPSDQPVLEGSQPNSAPARTPSASLTRFPMLPPATSPAWSPVASEASPIVMPPDFIEQPNPGPTRTQPVSPLAPSTSPIRSPTWAPTKSSDSSPGESQIPRPSPSPVASQTFMPSMNPAIRPVVAPTRAPSTKPSPTFFVTPGPSKSTDTTDTTTNPTIGPLTATETPVMFSDIIYPDFRFETWSELTVASQTLALQAGYSEDSWNRPGLSPVEQVIYSEIANEFDATTLSALNQLGFTSSAWDCWVNHYQGESWDGLVEKRKEGAVQALGWTFEIWTSPDTFESPETEFLRWYELSGAERLAAEELCYTQELWQGISLKDWDDIRAAKSNFMSALERRSPFSLAFVLNDIDSAQHRAFLWLTEGRFYWSYLEDRRIQRWVLAVLALSLSEAPLRDYSRALPSWVEGEDECALTSSSFPTICDDEGWVEGIKLHTTGLYGTLPFELSLLSKSLKRIDLAGNNIYGTLPTQLGALSLLERLQLQSNLLENTIPTEVGQLGNLTVLNLSQNLLNGAVPEQLVNLDNLEELNLKNNSFTGSIPTAVCSLPLLDEIDIDCTEVVCECCFDC